MDTFWNVHGNDSAAARHRIVDCATCGIRHSWCGVCQRAVCSHLDRAADTRFEAKRPTALSSLEPLHAFLAWVLAGISAEAQLAELTETPEGTYCIRIEMEREVPKPLAIPKCLIDSAVTNATSLRTLRNIIHTCVLGTAHTRLICEVREARAERSAKRTH
ncbi:MAG: hypothetical protein C5B48_15885 [Candidatus Rokuibacteriota bacterium]|nr:MAG: hypothetical protein C5B48_15885 [Candidatus Rokubacteria bacterium]